MRDRNVELIIKFSNTVETRISRIFLIVSMSAKVYWEKIAWNEMEYYKKKSFYQTHNTRYLL